MRNETALMIQSIRSVLHQEELLPENIFRTIDWEQLAHVGSFHSIRPILYQFLRTQTENQAVATWRNFSTEQTFLNLRYSAEIRRLLLIFASKGIRALPYKGALFIHELYQNKQVREVGDMDLLFPANEAKKALLVLLDEGYELIVQSSNFENLSKEDKLDAILASKNQYEVPLIKNNFAIDFHWGLCYGFLPYKMDAEAIFENATVRNFFGSECLMPAAEDLFFMLLLHHGGKENWTRMKHFADLIAFLTSYSSAVNWSAILVKSRRYRLNRQLLTGFYLLKKYFQVEIPTEIVVVLKTFRPRSEKNTVAYWDSAQYWSRLAPRWQLETILCQNQDDGFSYRKYIADFLLSYTKPNPVEKKRIWSFSNKFPLLNLISKVCTYLLRKS